MTDSLFCPDCGMLKSNCICGKSNNKSIIHETPNPVKVSKKSNYKTKTFHKPLNSKPYRIEDHIQSRSQIHALTKEYPFIDRDIIKNFPFKQPRYGQLDIIQELLDAIDDGYKYIILEAGTGTGKSVIASTLAKILGSAYILTRTKQLQGQYNGEFGFPIVKGRGNFSCLNEDSINNCNMGTCRTSLGEEKFACSYGLTPNKAFGSVEAFNSQGEVLFFNGDTPCNYWKQKADGVKSPITVMNYDYATLEFNHVKHFHKRDLLILDEAHNVENILMKLLEVQLDNEILKEEISKHLTPETLKDGEIEDWIIELDALIKSYKDIRIRDLAKYKAEKVKETINQLKDLKENLINDSVNWIIDANAKEGMVTFKPLKVDRIAKKYLLQYGDTVLFMSATILSKKLFCKWLGIKQEEAYFLKVPTPFKTENRPIILDFAGEMTNRKIKRSQVKALPIIRKILSKHENEKGLIHTNSYSNMDYIIQNLPSSRLMYHNSTNRERILHEFEENNENAVLVSPSMNEGVDLPYDKCRFQIIYKIPYPNLKDKQIAIRKKERWWYEYKTTVTLMQTYGRGMRADDDYCTTYIIDKSLKSIMNRPLFKKLIQDSFKEAIINPEEL